MAVKAEMVLQQHVQACHLTTKTQILIINFFSKYTRKKRRLKRLRPKPFH